LPQIKDAAQLSRDQASIFEESEMRTISLATLAAVALIAACQAQPAPGWAYHGQSGWMQGPYAGPMMAYGYCPGGGAGAQGGGRGWYGPGMMGGGGHMMGGGGAPLDTARTDAWLDEAKTAIGIAAEQETLWSAYADAVRADRTSMLEMHNQMPAMMQRGANGPDRLQAHLSLMSTRLASLQGVEAATRALYEAMSAEQRQRADDALWSGCW
jgi:hypothetical protein